jgi:hypothetical protein
VPRLSAFLGIVIYMYFEDHAPPHFHARYGKQEVQIRIDSLTVLRGSLPRVQLAAVITWGWLHQAELFSAWALASQHKNPGKIAPLKKGKRKKK